MSPAEPLRCSECGAVLGTADGFCWICCRPLSGPPPVNEPPKARPASPVQLPAPLPPPEAPRAQADLNLMASFTPLTLALIVIGAFSLFPPLGLVIGLCMLPALLSYYSVDQKRAAAPGEPEDKSFGARVQRIAARVLVGFAIFLLVIGVIAVALFCVCIFIVATAWH